MDPAARDPSLDNLLFLDGWVEAIGDGLYWMKFEVKRVTSTVNKPHGIAYSLTLHGPTLGIPDDSRLLGFDNAHGIRGAGGGGTREVWDHRHRLRTVRPYDYKDAATLLGDFYRAAESILDERGVKR